MAVHGHEEGAEEIEHGMDAVRPIETISTGLC